MIKNYGLDLEREAREVSTDDWVLGATSPVCLALIPEEERATYLPVGEVQRGIEDTMDCASRAPLNILETKFNYLLKNKKLSPANEAWLRDNGYITENGVEFSDAFIAINSGTTRQGNSLKAPLEAIRKNGMVPKKKLPLLPYMTWKQYHNPNRISDSLRTLGLEFVSRFTINYERVYSHQFSSLLPGDLLDVAGYAWPPPLEDGSYPRSEEVPNHAFAVFKTPCYQIFDNYIDTFDSDYIKNLAPDYAFIDYGYRVVIAAEHPVPIAPNPPKDIKVCIYTTAKSDWFQKYFKIVNTIIEKATAVKVTEIIAVELTTEPNIIIGPDGEPTIDFKWLNENLTKPAAAKGFNTIALHLEEADRKRWGLTEKYNGRYSVDNNPYFEFWFVADKNQWAAATKSTLPEWVRLFLHELGHGFVHFTGVKQQLIERLGLQQQDDTLRDPVHYLDYKERDIASLYPMISFEENTLLQLILKALIQFKDKLMEKIESKEALPPLMPVSHPEPVKKPESRLEQWANAIKEFEGWWLPSPSKEGSISYRNNNPGNLRWSSRQAGQRGGFSYFNTYEEGWQALLHQLRIAANGGSQVYWPDMTLLQFFSKYAPSNDGNHPAIYAAHVANKLGVTVDFKIKNLL